MGLIARAEEKTYALRVLVEKTEQKKKKARPRPILENNINMHFQEKRWRVEGQVAGSSVR